jgi:hypothetical protein
VRKRKIIDFDHEGDLSVYDPRDISFRHWDWAFVGESIYFDHYGDHHIRSTRNGREEVGYAKTKNRLSSD